jgi:hypothetical protein
VAVFSRLLSGLLIFLLVCAPLLAGHTIPEHALQLQVVTGGTTPQFADHKQTQDICVRVVDERNQVVAGVAVTFQLPDQEVNASFSSGKQNLLVSTDSRGLASATGIRWGAVAGIIPIRVTAVAGSAHAGLIIRQELVWPPEPTAIALISPTVPTPLAAHPPAPGALAAPAESGTSKALPAATNVEIVTARSGAIAKVPESETPAVDISSSGKGGSTSKKKWLLLALAAGAAGGVAVAFLSKKSSTATSASSATTSAIGSPTVNIGPP